ncbi:MAG: hypothetical protein HC780_04565 [Leptolyngbyaceae cyanobacterium CSU_1_3]|nr:hypothetical protein [Leptolyngbyaceae cyanobacterium CSU_1_3]
MIWLPFYPCGLCKAARAFCPNVIFCKVFAYLYSCFFASIPKLFEVEEVLPTSGGQLLCLDGDNLSGSFGSGDGGIVGLEIGEEGLEVSEENLKGLFGRVVLSFDVGIDLLEDLNFLSVWEVVFRTVCYWFSAGWVKWVLVVG